MKKWISFLLPFVGLALFAVILWKTGVDKIIGVFGAADVVKLLWVPVITAVIIILRGLRWQYLMRVVGIQYSLWQCSKVWLVGFFAGAVTPAKMGDAVRALYVRENTGRSFGEAFLTVFIDRLWDLLFVLLLGMISVLLFSRYYIQLPSMWIVATATVVIVVIVYLVLNRAVMQKLAKPVFNALMPKKYRERFSLTFDSFYDSLGVYARDWNVVLIPFLLTLACWVAVFGLAYYMTLVLEIDVSLPYIVLIMPIVTLAELIPVSVSGLGTRDATVIYFFSVVGVSSAMAVGFSIGYLLAGTYLTSLAGFIVWLRHPVRLGS